MDRQTDQIRYRALHLQCVVKSLACLQDFPAGISQMTWWKLRNFPYVFQFSQYKNFQSKEKAIWYTLMTQFLECGQRDTGTRASVLCGKCLSGAGEGGCHPCGVNAQDRKNLVRREVDRGSMRCSMCLTAESEDLVIVFV